MVIARNCRNNANGQGAGHSALTALAPDVISPVFFTPEQMAMITGLSLSTIWRRIRDGSMPFVQPGGRRKRVLIPRTFLDQLDTQRQSDEHEVVGKPINPLRRRGCRQPAWISKLSATNVPKETNAQTT